MLNENVGHVFTGDYYELIKWHDLKLHTPPAGAILIVRDRYHPYSCVAVWNPERKLWVSVNDVNEPINFNVSHWCNPPNDLYPLVYRSIPEAVNNGK